MDVMENLRELYLDGTGIKNLPSSIVLLKGIGYLDLAHCENLESLPESICNLRYLKTLLVHNCPKLDKFPSVLSFKYWKFSCKLMMLGSIPMWLCLPQGEGAPLLLPVFLHFGARFSAMF